jgi:hypothetical protein
MRSLGKKFDRVLDYLGISLNGVAIPPIDYMINGSSPLGFF